MKNKILIYDDYCPLCTWYSGLFVKYGFLPADGRKAFSALEQEMLSKIDFEKGKNEIPLVDVTSGKVLYGIEALLEILNQRIPFIKAIGNCKPINWILKKTYKLISYNRKLIVAKKCGNAAIDCAPDFNYRYRFLFMFICLIFNTVMLFPVHNIVLSKLSYYHLIHLELQLGHFVFVAVNCTLTFLSFSKEKAFEYLGQVNMLALTAILLISPLLFLKNFFNQTLITIYLTAATIFIFKEYVRRMEYADVLSKNKWVVGINLFCLVGFILFLFN